MALSPTETRAAASAEGAAAGALILSSARTPTEQALVASWADSEHPGAPLLGFDAPALIEHVAGDPLIVPVRVTWLPRERDGERNVRIADLLALTNPRKPWSRLQPRIARREPDRARVVAGEPALASELRERFAAESGGGDERAFADFVRRQATLACERAERAVIGDRYKVPRLVAEQITASARFRAEVDQLAEGLGRPFEEVLAEAEHDLRELATVQSPLAVDLYRAVLSPMHARAWDVEVDVESLERLRELNRRHALVFLPCHRSYVDPLVLGDVLHHHDFPPNHLLGGNNMAFFPIGQLGRRAGVIFIRRDFGDDKVYKLAIRELLGYVVAKRFNIEWYIEGGRTRTGKLRPPRYGLLHYLVRAIDSERAEDVTLVPVSIVYEHMQEVEAIAREHGGATKCREGFTWFLDYIRRQSHKAGSARVTFGDAFSLRDALAQAGDGGARLEKVAFAVCDGINRATPVTGTSLVTFALLGVRERALTLDEVQAVTAPLLDYVESRGVPGPIAQLRTAEGVRSALDALVHVGVASRYDGGDEPVWSIPPGQYHSAAFYRNGAIHWLVNRAIVELACVRLGDVPRSEEALETAWEDALALRDLLKLEFFFADKPRFREELTAETALLGGEETGPDPSQLLAGAGVLVAQRALRSFFDAQLVVARRLVSGDSASDRDEFVAGCLRHGRQLLLRSVVQTPDSVSKELYGGAFDLAANRGLTQAGGEQVVRARRAFLAEVEEVVGRLDRIAARDAELMEEALHRHAG